MDKIYTISYKVDIGEKGELNYVVLLHFNSRVTPSGDERKER